MPTTEIPEAICPACDGRGMELRAHQIELPFLGESLETTLKCNTCGYRHADFVLTSQNEPTRHAYTIRTEDDMMVRVVRSGSGTIRIPELGILIEPGIASEAFISNIEGVLVRIERVLTQLRHDAHDDQDQLHRILELEERFTLMRRGEAEPVTLVLDDPLGNSGILHEDSQVEALPEDIANELKVGSFIIDPGNITQVDEKVEEEEEEDS